MKAGFVLGFVAGLAAFVVVWELAKPKVIETAGDYVHDNVITALPDGVRQLLEGAIGLDNIATVMGNGFKLALQQNLP